MSSKYDPHAALVEELFAAGESITGIARLLEQRFAIPIDASGLRRWLMRRLAKREKRMFLLDPKLAASTTAIQQAQAIDRVERENRSQEKSPVKPVSPPKEGNKEESDFSMPDLIKHANATAEAKGAPEEVVAKKKSKSIDQQIKR